MNYKQRFMALYRRQVSRPSPKKKKKKAKSKINVSGDLKNSCNKKRSEKQRIKGKINRFECRVPKNSKER